MLKWEQKNDGWWVLPVSEFMEIHITVAGDGKYHASICNPDLVYSEGYNIEFPQAWPVQESTLENIQRYAISEAQARLQKALDSLAQVQ